MKYYQIVFSPTGGTERVSKAITQNWSDVDTIDLSAPDTKFADICFDSALVNKNWTEQVPKPRIKRSAITLQTPSLTEP